MMINNKLKLIVVSTAVILYSSCSHKVLDFALISSKNVDLSKASSFTKGNNRVIGKDVVHLVIIFPTGNLSVKEALDKAIESTPNCVALLDGVIYTKFWFIPYIYGQQSMIVEGTPLIDKSSTMNSLDMPTYGKIELDKKGSIKSIENISNTSYYALKEKIAKNSKGVKIVNN